MFSYYWQKAKLLFSRNLSADAVEVISFSPVDWFKKHSLVEHYYKYTLTAEFPGLIGKFSHMNPSQLQKRWMTKYVILLNTLPLKSNGWFPQNTPLIISYCATTMATNIFECNVAAKMNSNPNKISFLLWPETLSNCNYR